MGIMLKRFPLLALLAVLALHASAKDAWKKEPYFDAKEIDYVALIPEPPALKSPADQKELDDIVTVQKTLTDDQRAHIKLEASYNTYDIFEDVLGSWFAKENADKLPAMKRLLKREADTTSGVMIAAKDHWKRLRPYVKDARIHSPIGAVDGWSYPSGHSMRATVDSLVLAQLDPAASEGITMRGVRVGEDRVRAGVHFETDVVSGRVLGKAIFAKLMATPEFQTDLAEAKAEVAVELKP